MNLGKVVFGFFILLAATLNFGFVYGAVDAPHHHHVSELFAAIVVNIIAMVLKFGDRTQVGAIHLATSLVAVLQLLLAAAAWGWSTHIIAEGQTAASTASAVSLAAGALFANIVSVTILIGETLMLRR